MLRASAEQPRHAALIGPLPKPSNEQPADIQYVDPQLECAECQLRNSGDENVVSQDDIDQSKDEARKQCQQLGFPTKP